MSVTLSDNNFRNIRAFVNNLCNVCANCFRRHKCATCDLNGVQKILRMLDEGGKDIDMTHLSRFEQRIRIILKTILIRGKCRSEMIDIGTNGTRQNKWRCLNILVRKGVIRITKDELGLKCYEVIPDHVDIVKKMIGM